MATKSNAAQNASVLVKNINEKRRNKEYAGISPLATALMTTLEPLVTTLDSNPNWVDDPSTDQGHQHPSQQDVGLQILLGFTIQNFHTQLYGPIFTKKGQIDSIKDRLDNQERLMSEHVAKYQDDPLAMSTDPRTYTLNHYFQVAEARFNAVKDMLDSFKAVYQQITGTVWQPQGAAAQNGSAVRKVEITDEERKNAEALMTRFLKKSPNNSAGSAVA